MILRQRDGQKVVCLDQSRERVLVRRRAFAVHVTLHGSGGVPASVRELPDEFVALELRGRRRLHKLLQEFGGVSGFGDARGEFSD